MEWVREKLAYLLSCWRVTWGLPLPRTPFCAVVVLLAVALVGVIWAPYGFSMGGLIEEWDMRFLFQSGRMGWTAFPGQPMGDLFSARPLTPAPFMLAHRLSPDTFVGLHLLLIFALGIKVIVGSAIGMWLFRDRLLALFMGALVLVFPADTQQIALRNVHINFAVALMMVACLFALHAIYEGSTRRRRMLIASAVVAGIIGCGIYEPVFPLYLLAPLLLLARLGLRASWKLIGRRHYVSLAWLSGLIVSATYLFYAIAIQKSAYQISLAGGSSGGVIKSVLGNAHAVLDTAAYRVFIDGWRVAWEVTTVGTVHWVYLPATCLGVLVVLFALAGQLVPERPSRLLLLSRSAAVGVLALVAAYAPILASVSHQAITQRTFLTAAPGAALVAVVFLALLGIFSRGVMTIVAAIAISLGLGTQVYQHDVYMRAYVDAAAPYLRYVANKSDPEKKVHLIIDESGVGGFLTGIYITKLIYGVPLLRAAYNDSYLLCKNIPLNVSMPFSNCRLEGNQWVVSSADGAVKTFSATEVDVIRMDRSAFTAAQLDSVASQPAAFSPFLPSRTSTERFDCAADSMWGFSRFCHGEGWSDGATIRSGSRRVSAFYAIAPSPSLFIDLAPTEATYRLQILLAHPIPKEIAGSWRLEINGGAVSVKPASATLFEATVPSSRLVNGTNVMKIHNAQSAADKPALVVRRVVLAPYGDSKVDWLASDAVFKPKAKYTISDQPLLAALVNGFSVPEPNGIWTDGSQALLVFRTPNVSGQAALEISAAPFLNERHPTMEVEAWVGGTRVSIFEFRLGQPSTKLRIPLPQDKTERGEPMEIRFSIRDPASPSAVGAGDRYLGLFFQEVKVVQ